jgi:hypothetical protein
MMRSWSVSNPGEWFVVFGRIHPAENAPPWRILGVYRWHWRARLRAWWHEATGIDAIAFVLKPGEHRL